MSAEDWLYENHGSDWEVEYMRGRFNREEAEYVDVGEVKVLRETEKSWICSWPGGERDERPVPKSQMSPDVLSQIEVGWEGTMQVSDWFAGKIDEERPAQAYVDVRGAVVMREAATGKAIQVKVGNGQPIWIPVYSIHKDSKVRYDGDSGVLTLLEQMAAEKNLTGEAPAKGMTAGEDARKKPGGADQRNMFDFPDADDDVPF